MRCPALADLAGIDSLSELSYRRLRIMFALTKHWKDYDPFAKQKLSTFKSSAHGVITLADSFAELVDGRQDGPDDLTSEQANEAAFLEMAQVALWGNATVGDSVPRRPPSATDLSCQDLSLLTHLSADEIRRLQRTGKAAQQEAAASILQNHLPRAWEHIKSLSGGRVDFVLDNAGFELYCDLVFADCTPIATSFLWTRR